MIDELINRESTAEDQASRARLISGPGFNKSLSILAITEELLLSITFEVRMEDVSLSSRRSQDVYSELRRTTI
jgi:hypothetical protein